MHTPAHVVSSRKQRHTDSHTLTLSLQILPPGASKGKGVAALLKALEIDPAHVLAIGDAENDVEVRAQCLCV